MVGEPVQRDRAVRLMWLLIDAGIWGIAIVVATWLRYLFAVQWTLTSSTAWMATAAVVLHVAIGFFIGPYRAGHVRGSYDEMRELGVAVIWVAVVLFGWAMFANPLMVPRTVPVIAALIALNLMMSTRFVLRSRHRRRISRADNRGRTIVFGAGSGGRLLVRNLLMDETSPYAPVAVLDDDPGKRGLLVEGLRVRGGRNSIATIATATHADTLVIAIPSADAATIAQLKHAAEVAGLRAMAIPTLAALMERSPSAADIRDINLEDLLGRRPITLDTEAIAAQVRGRTVLVTGAGGSIGSELCRQISLFAPGRLVMLDRDESAMHAVQLELSGHGLLQDDTIVLADIRDPDALHRAFHHHRPDVVFHAAALKHLPLLEQYPLEAWKSNVLGTLNVLTAARAVDTEVFVNISTDKAADPTCVLGYSKRIAERLTAQLGRGGAGRYMTVRFGNVLGSRGSVIPAFTAQIRQGGPITVTDPNVQRYFMLIPEACQLVMQAAVIGKPAEVMVLEMGRQVKIADIAQTLIDLSGRDDISITYTGLRPGEKMSEDLFSRQDQATPTDHELVSRVDVPPLDGTDLHGMTMPPERASPWMRQCAFELVSPDAPIDLEPGQIVPLPKTRSPS